MKIKTTIIGVTIALTIIGGLIYNSKVEREKEVQIAIEREAEERRAEQEKTEELERLHKLLLTPEKHNKYLNIK